jgi:hypothetical protein
MSCEAAAGQEKFAEHIAQNTDLTVEQAIGCMLANAKDITAAKAKNSPNAFSQFMDRSEQPNVGASVSTVREGDDAGDDESARATASLCKRLGLKGFKDS